MTANQFRLVSNETHLRDAEGRTYVARLAFGKYLERRPRVWLTSLELGCIVIVTLWLGIMAKHSENRSLDLRAAQLDLQNFSLVFEENILRSIGEIDKTLRYLRNSIATANEPRDYTSLVRSTDVSSDLLVQVAIIDDKGMMMASSARPQQFPPLDLSDREHFRYHLNNAADVLFISKPVMGRASGKMSVQLTRKFLKSDGTFGGVVVASFDPNHFNMLFSRVELGAGASYALVGRDGVVRASGGQAPEEFSLGAVLDWSRFAASLDGRSSATHWEPNVRNGARDLVVVRLVNGQPLAATARIPEKAVFEASTHSLMGMVLAGLALSCLTAMTAWRGWQFEMQGKQKTEQLQTSYDVLRDTNVELNGLNAKLKSSEAEARRQKSLFQSVFDSSPDGLAHVDNTFKTVNANATLAVMFGCEIEDLRGVPLEDFFASPGDFELVKAHFTDASKSQIAQPVHCARKNGQTFLAQVNIAKIVNAVGEALGMLVIIRDVTDQQKRESELRNKQRLEALGRLTGGIAHDFNNLLTVISGNLQLVGMEPQPERRMRYLAEAETATQMGARLNQRLITFARQRRLEPAQIDLDSLVNDLLDLIRRSIGEGIVLKANLRAAPSAVCIDASEMENAILNLVVNARDAMENGGTLSIETSQVEIGDGGTGAIGDLATGSYIRLVVADTGEGMSEEVAARACEPFFTTKAEGKGAGLGLTAIHGFITQSGGHLAIESEVGRGTSVSIHLPRLADGAMVPSKVGNESPAAMGRGETILMVEDNAAVRTVTMDRLKVLGYRVIDAASGAEALDIAARGDAIDLVFSDIVMPGGISGFELARRLRTIRPDLRILLTSGFPDEAAKLGHSTDEPIVVLRKPYRLEELAGRISLALNSK